MQLALKSSIDHLESIKEGLHNSLANPDDVNAVGDVEDL